MARFKQLDQCLLISDNKLVYYIFIQCNVAFERLDFILKFAFLITI